MTTGVYIAYKKDRTQYFRASLTYRNKHISLGSFDTFEKAATVYQESLEVLSNSTKFYLSTDTCLTSYSVCSSWLSFEKFIILLNYRDNQIYFKTPIYLNKNYFFYFLSKNNVLKFDVDDLFYYAKHRISCRGGYFYVNDYGMQTSILSRYGIRNHAVSGRDYVFKNGDHFDYRYHNIQVINHYHGVRKEFRRGITVYKVIIHINGDFIVGIYRSESEAAIAYNKAVDRLKNLVSISYQKNYLENMSSIEYASIYNRILFQKKFKLYLEALESDKSDIIK